MYEDDRQEITINDYRDMYCKSCYWAKWHGCDISTVKIEFCVSAELDRCEYKLKGEK